MLTRRTPLRSKSLRKKLRRRISLAGLKKKLWEVFSQYIRRRNADSAGMVFCFTCGSPHHWKDLDAGHYVAKSLGLSVYFEEKNVHPQCTGCNRFRHGNLTQYALKLKETYGDSILEELDAIRKIGRKISRSGYEEMIERYKMKVLQIEKSA